MSPAGPRTLEHYCRPSFLFGPGQVVGFILCLFFQAGCDTTRQERLQQFNEGGVHLFRQGDFQAARENFEMALELKPEDADILYNLGQCFDRQGDWPKAEKYYRGGLDKKENHEDCRFALAVLLYRTGRRDEAGRMIQDWLAGEPQQAAPYALDGWRLRQERAFPHAQSRLQQALAIDPQSSRALIELAILYEQMERPDRALALYERSLVKNPHQPEVIERLNQLRTKNVGRPLPD